MKTSEIIEKYYSSKKDISKVRLALSNIESSIRGAEESGYHIKGIDYGVWYYSPSTYVRPLYMSVDPIVKNVSPLGSVMLEKKDYKFTGDYITDIAYVLNIWEEWVEGFTHGYIGHSMLVTDEPVVHKTNWYRNYKCGYELGNLFHRKHILGEVEEEIIDPKWKEICEMRTDEEHR